MFKRLLCLAILFGLPCSAFAAEILTTIRPLQLMVKDLLPAGYSVGVLLDGSESPHDFSLSMHDVRRLKNADMVVWVGENFEVHLSDAFQRYIAEDNLFSLSSVFADYKQEDHHGHDHDHHHQPEETAEHLWVSYDNSLKIASNLAKALALRYPNDAKGILQRLDKFLTNLEQARKGSLLVLGKQRRFHFAVYHDGYRPLVDELHLDQRAYVVRYEHVAVGVAHLLELKRELTDASCLIADVNERDHAEPMAQKLGLPLVESDLLARELPEGAGYVGYLRALTEGFMRCSIGY